MLASQIASWIRRTFGYPFWLIQTWATNKLHCKLSSKQLTPHKILDVGRAFTFGSCFKIQFFHLFLTFQFFFSFDILISGEFYFLSTVCGSSEEKDTQCYWVAVMIVCFLKETWGFTSALCLKDRNAVWVTLPVLKFTPFQMMLVITGGATQSAVLNYYHLVYIYKCLDQQLKHLWKNALSDKV